MTIQSLTLAEMGWSNFFMTQLDLDDLETLAPMRVSEVQRSILRVISESGPHNVTMPPDMPTGAVAVGDWVLVEPENLRVNRCLDRRSLLTRKGAGTEARQQLIAANIDTLFIVSSCNADFNPARLERYIALAVESGAQPVIVLTKSDIAENPAEYKEQAKNISPLAEAIVLNAKDLENLDRLRPWCGKGQTVALVGSSGVGKSTLTNGLAGTSIHTTGIREDDAKGRHTTTNRALYQMENGGWLIDTPGMREIGVQEASEGIDAVFADVVELAESCRFNDCKHASEPGCAVRSAIDDGTLAQSRLERWQKLQREDQFNTATLSQRREHSRKLERTYSGGRARGKFKRGL